MSNLGSAGPAGGDSLHETGLAQLVAAGRVGTWRYDPTTGEVVVSDLCKANFGFTPEEDLDFDKAMAAIHEADRPHVRRAIEHAIAGGGNYEADYRVVWRDGSVRWINARGQVDTADGRSMQLCGVTFDITAPRRAEQLALEQNALLELVASGHPRAECLDALNTAVARLHPQVRGCFVMANGERTGVAEVAAQFPPAFIDGVLSAPVGAEPFGTCGATIHYGRAFSCSDLQQDRHWHAAWRGLCLAHGIRACHSVPVVRPDGIAVGSYCLCMSEPREPDEWERRIAAFGAHVASILVERDRVHDALRERESQLATELADAQRLQEVSVELVAENDVGALYQKVIAAACAIMRSQYASMQMLHAAGEYAGRLQLLAHHGFTPEAARAWEWVPADSRTTCGQALRGGQRVVCENVGDASEVFGPELSATYRQARIASIQSTPLKSRDGRVVGMLSTHWAHRHRASDNELRLLDILARLAADIIERRHAEAALRNADRRKDEFLATLAHELRNPMAPLRNCLHILRMGGATAADATQLYEVMDRQLLQLVRLVDDLLEVSRITRGRIELDRKHVALADIVTAAVETCQPLLDAYAHRFEVELPAEPVALDADPLRMAQVLSNLLNNAAKYTQPGGRISLRAQVEGPRVRISVIDNGAGVSDELKGRIFEMFAQGEKDHDPHGGLGIGLTLVRSLVTLHGGTVEVHSEGLGHGSEFIVELPLLDSTDALTGPLDRSCRHVTRSPRRVLVVDDNHEHADSLVRLLRMCGHHADASYDGHDCLAAIATTRPDVVFLDLGMPSMDGYEACRRIRSLPGGNEIAIIAVTGWGQEADRLKSARSGFDAHLVKPVDPAVMIGRLESLTRATPA